ncbi:MFS transporter [Streptomyces sp. NPDC047002]|uniref:MFS transporter n=1 Tax=Streptomyces sp. NPDC047002 TaxID=3155475 RepID=UPI0034555B6F
MTEIEQRTVRRVSKRLVPFLLVSYFVSYLDRTNLSFAALQMNKDLGLTAGAFGFGAGAFFLTYFLFEVPSNLMLARAGASRWIARIMVTWGLVSGAMVLVRGEASFYTVRILLGAAEAGFFPGVIFYLGLWFPAAHRARIISLFMVSVPLSVVVGAPLSGALLSLDGALGLRGWQWVYIVEAVPAVVLGVVTFFYLSDSPKDARWLPDEQRAWLGARLAAERAEAKADAGHVPVLRALTHPRILALAVVDVAICSVNTGVGVFLPQIIQGFGVRSDVGVTLTTAVPYLVAAVGMVLWSRHSDRTGERRLHTAVPLGLAALGIAGAVWIPGALPKMVCLCGVMFGLYAMQPVFWTLSMTFLTGAAAAGGVAAINSIGNLAGFVSPYAMGSAKDATGSFSAGMLGIACTGVLGVVVVLLVGRARGRGAAGRPADGARPPAARSGQPGGGD